MANSFVTTTSRYLHSRKFLAALAMLSLAAMVPLLTTSTYLLHIFVMIFMYCTLAESFNIITGYSGYVSFGHVAFFGLGSYAFTILLFKGWPIIFCLIAGGIVAIALAIGIGVPCLRLKGAYFGVTTLAINEMMMIIVLNLPEITRGAMGISLHEWIWIPKSTHYYIFLFETLVAILVVYIVENSKLGLALVAIKEDEDAAEATGIHAFRYKITVYVIGAFIAGVVGGTYALYMSYIDPETVFALPLTATIVHTVLIGGLGSYLGPIIGSPILVLMYESLRTSLPHLHAVISGFLIVVMVLFAQQGILGVIRKYSLSLTGRKRENR